MSSGNCRQEGKRDTNICSTITKYRGFDPELATVNRLVGDEQEPEDIRWATPGRRGGGSLMQEVPEWLRTGSPRPSQGRKTVTSYKFFRKDSPLLPSGLLGPVTLQEFVR